MVEISAIVPVYNGRAYLKSALASAFCQTLPPCEVIVVDDGSTDGSCDDIMSLAGSGSCVPLRLIRQTNGGQSAARNSAAAVAKGELLAFLDQDDVWYPDHLAALAARFADMHKPGWVYSDLDQIDVRGLLVARHVVAARGPHPRIQLDDMVAKDMFVVPTATMVSRRAFEAVDGFDERLSGYEDDDLFLRLFREGFDSIFVSEATAQWRLYEGSASTTRRMSLSRKIFVRKLLEMFPDDRGQMRFFARDLIAPRFLPTALAGFARAIAQQDEELLALHREEARFLLSIGRFGARTHIGVALMRWPGLFRAALRIAYPDRAWRLGL